MESKVVRGQEMREEKSAYLAIPNFQLFVGQYGEQNFISVANHLDKRSSGMRRSQNFRPAQWEIHRCFLSHRTKRIRLHTVTSIHSPVHSRSKFGYDIPYTLVLHIIVMMLLLLLLFSSIILLRIVHEIRPIVFLIKKCVPSQ